MLNDCIKIQSIWVISRHRLAVIVHQPSSLSPQPSEIYAFLAEMRKFSYERNRAYVHHFISIVSAQTIREHSGNNKPTDILHCN